MPYYDWWPHVWFPIFPLFFMVLCLIIMFFMMRMMHRHAPWGGRDDRNMPQRSALDILNERYVKGEIDKAEYDEKRRVIS